MKLLSSLTRKGVTLWRHAYVCPRTPLIQYNQRALCLSTISPSIKLDQDVNLAALDTLNSEFQNALHSGFTPKQTVTFVKQFHRQVYDSLAIYPWFQNQNLDVAYIQLLLNMNLDQLMDCFNKHPVYNGLYLKSLDMMDDLTAAEAAHVAVSFIAVGLPADDRLVHDAIIKCQNELHHMNIEELSAASTLTRVLARAGLELSASLTQRCAEIMDETPACCDLLESLLNTYNTVQLFSSNELSSKFQEKFIQIVKPNQCLLKDSRTMGAVLRGIRRFPLNKSEDHFYFRNTIANLILNTLRNEVDFNTLTHSCIGELCNNLQSARLYYRDVAERFQDRALEIISNSDRVCEISNSLYAFNSKFISRDARRIIESQVFKHLHNADILILSNIADSLKNINCRNTDILNTFHQLIIDKADYLFVYITRLEKIVKCLSWCNFRTKEQEDKFMSILVEKLSDTQLGLVTWCLSTVASYLLRNTRYTIDPVLYDKLLRIIPQCKVRDLYPILVAMNSAQNTVTPSTANQLYKLQTMIYENVAQRVDTIDSMDLLSQFLTELLSKSQNPDSNIIERLMAMYPKFTDRQTMPQFHKVMLLHTQLRYYSPRVFEHLAEYVIKNDKTDKGSNALDLMRFMTLMNAVGYTSSRMSQLRGILLNFYDVHSAEMEVDEIVTYVQLLAGMQIFAEDIISDIFSMEFIQRVDRYLEANPEKRQQVEYTMMKLNRTVVIECPELDVPWFHDHYCNNHIVNEYNPTSLPFTNRVDQSMRALFGDSNHHKIWSYSPYYYHMNFELFLDESGRAINVTTMDKKKSKIAQKVAIRCLVESNFCYNSSELNGFEKSKQRHLEMLGYKLVDIPYFEWNSMGLADEQSRSEYLRNKIFS